LRSPKKILSELGTTPRFDRGKDVAAGRLSQEYKARCCVECLKKVAGCLPSITSGEVAELQCVMANRITKVTHGSPTANSQPVGRTSVTSDGSTEPNAVHDECQRHGRTQWDAMTEAIRGEKFRVGKLAILIFVRYGLRTGAVSVLAYKLIEIAGQHR
jgi:hypothetical protein